MYDACVDMEGLKVTVIDEEGESKGDEKDEECSASETDDLDYYYNQPEILTDEDRGKSEERDSVGRKLPVNSDERWKIEGSGDIGQPDERRKSSEKQIPSLDLKGKGNENLDVIEKGRKVEKKQNGDVVKDCNGGMS